MTLNQTERVLRLLEILLDITLANIRFAAGRDGIGELVNILHREEFCSAVSKSMVRDSRHCQLITYDVFKKNSNW